MKYTTPILLAATLAAAAPTNFTEDYSLIYPRDFSGSINFFERFDCKNNCVETGYCLGGQTNDGMTGSEANWIGWDNVRTS